MKKKYFLRGLGIGILLTALVLCIGYRRQDAEKTVVQRARELGMEFPERTPDALLISSGSAAEVTSGPAATPKREKVTSPPKETSSPDKTDKPKDIATPIASAKTSVSRVPTSKPATDTRSTRNFTVRGGLLSSSVAREMKQAGIIQDADAFDEYLEESGMARNVRAGKYKIPVGASYEEIARIITRQD